MIQFKGTSLGLLQRRMGIGVRGWRRSRILSQIQQVMTALQAVARGHDLKWWGVQKLESSEVSVHSNQMNPLNAFGEKAEWNSAGEPGAWSHLCVLPFPMSSPLSVSSNHSRFFFFYYTGG